MIRDWKDLDDLKISYAEGGEVHMPVFYQIELYYF